MGYVLGIGTVKGAWFARTSDRDRWDLSGPHHRGWEVTTFARTPAGEFLLATGSTWYGAAIHASTDLERWDQIVAGPSYSSESNRNLERIWSLTAAEDRLYAGVAEAGLFRSDDGGTNWHPVSALNDHETRDRWQPGLGGLALHRVLVDPDDALRVWVAISAVGVLASDDGGETWEPRNDGVQIAVPDDAADIGYCVHCITADPADADRIWRQDHRGVYRTADGGRTWQRIQSGIPGTGFGFPIARSPRDGALFVVPLESDEYRMPVDGRLRVYRSIDDGDSWQATGRGLPDDPSYTGVLRGAMDVDANGGVYFGTTGGEVWCSANSGEDWRRLPITLPRVTSVKVFES